MYYAAIVGFDVAVRLDLVKADRSTYYLAESMHQELEFNIENMNSYLKRTQKERYVYNEHIAGIKLNDYVMKAAMNSESIFEIKPKLLTEISLYCFTVGNAIKQYYDSGMQSPSRVMDVVKKETEKIIAQKTLERLAEYKSALAGTIEQRGIGLN